MSESIIKLSIAIAAGCNLVIFVFLNYQVVNNFATVLPLPLILYKYDDLWMQKCLIYGNQNTGVTVTGYYRSNC